MREWRGRTVADVELDYERDFDEYSYGCGEGAGCGV